MEPLTPPKGFKRMLRLAGPGIVVAATGVGAGDLVAATKAGASLGMAVLWTAAMGAILKYALAEGGARWQLATGATLIEGWVKHFKWPIHLYFLLYLLIWTFMVSAALMSACGLAAHALVPALSVKTWAIIHGLFALGFVLFGKYSLFELIMKIVIAIMFAAIVGSALIQAPDLGQIVKGLIVPTIPKDSTLLILGVLGGVGGTLTLLSYNYWIREKQWNSSQWLKCVRFDLGVGYLLTGLFGIAVIILAAMVLLPKGVKISNSQGVLEMAGMLGDRFGETGTLVFLIGFWGAVVSSIIGVWQGVPYLVSDYANLWKERRTGIKQNNPGIDPKNIANQTAEQTANQTAAQTAKTNKDYPLTKGGLYKGYAVFMTLLPMSLLYLEKPVWLIVAYSATGALFMPFLAMMLLIMNNNKEWMGDLKNRIYSNFALVLALLLFTYIALHKLF